MLAQKTGKHTKTEIKEGESMKFYDTPGFSASPEDIVDICITHMPRFRYQPQGTIIKIGSLNPDIKNDDPQPIIEIRNFGGGATFVKKVQHPNNPQKLKTLILTKSQKWKKVETVKAEEILFISWPFTKHIPKKKIL